MEWYALCLLVGFIVGRLARPLAPTIVDLAPPPDLLVAWWHEGGDHVFQMSNGKRYRGRHTLWFDYDTVRQVDSGSACRFSDLEQAIKWGRHDDKKRERNDVTGLKIKVIE